MTGAGAGRRIGRWSRPRDPGQAVIGPSYASARDALCAASMVLTLAPEAGPHDGDRKESRVQIIDVAPENRSIAGAPASEVRAEEIAARRARS